MWFSLVEMLVTVSADSYTALFQSRIEKVVKILPFSFADNHKIPTEILQIFVLIHFLDAVTEEALHREAHQVVLQ